MPALLHYCWCVKKNIYFLGDGVTYPQTNQKVTVHYALFLDNCDFIESSREVATPFSFNFGAGEVITGFERGKKNKDGLSS